MLGFEDIVEEHVVDGGVDASTPRNDGTIAAQHCAPTARLVSRTLLASLVDDAGVGELWPRVTDDELTITFARFTPAQSSYETRCFIARRASPLAEFSPPQALFGTTTPPVRFASPSGDGGRLYVSQDEVGRRILATAEAENETLVALPSEGLHDQNWPVYVEATGELFFAVADAYRRYSIYRRTSDGTSFGPLERVGSIEQGGDAGVVSYVEPVLSGDGRHLYYSTYRHLDGGATALGEAYVATRADTTTTSFGEPQRLDELDPSFVRLGAVSRDGCRLYTYRLENRVFRIFREERASE